MLDWLLQQSAACAFPVTVRGEGSPSNNTVISVHQPPGAMIDKTWGSAELEEGRAHCTLHSFGALEDTAKNGLGLLSLLGLLGLLQ
jgi:hypothetical protein